MAATFSVGTRIVSGPGALGQVLAEFDARGARAVAVVADRGVADAGLLDRVLAEIGPLPVACTVLADTNPDVAAVERASDVALAASADSVLAVGGGSGICVAKAVAILLANPGPIQEYDGVGRVPQVPRPTVAVPTTAGSGSEVSKTLVLHEAGRDREIVVSGSGYEPVLAVLDGTLLRDLPRTPMLYAALDALTHALESLWVRRRTVFTDALAVAAADGIFDTLPRALDERRDDDLQRLLDVSCAANLACGNTGLGLVHALTSAPSVRLAHGYQNGVLLPHVARFNETTLDVGHRRYIARLDELYDQVGFAGRFAAGEADNRAGAAMLLASTGHAFRDNNALPSTDDELIAVLHEAGVSAANPAD